MGSLARALGRLLVMGGVMAAVLVTCLVTGVGTTIAVALAIVLAGLVGLVGVVRRSPHPGAPPTEMASPTMMAGSTLPAHGEPTASHRDAAVEAMKPATAVPDDPEALMPRWRRPSLLAARRADPARATVTNRTPLRFGQTRAEADLRMVRYAVVPVTDRPDELLGIRLAELAAGDEVEVVDASGAFLEVICPSGERGWIHRTTVSQAASPSRAPAHVAEPEAEDALTTLLAARGLQ